jgi:hypothetical protein
LSERVPPYSWRTFVEDAETVGAECIEYRQVPERRNVVATQAQFTQAAEQADGGASIPELRRLRAPTSAVDPGQQCETGTEATAEVFDSAKAQLAAVDAVVSHAHTTFLAIGLHVATGGQALPYSVTEDCADATPAYAPRTARASRDLFIATIS